MRPLARVLLLAGLAVAGLYSSTRIVAHSRADALAQTDPEQALRLLPGHPAALRALAERQLAAGQTAAAAATAAQLVRSAPLDGHGWRILGQLQAAAGKPDRARALFARAVALDPRDARARAWLADDLLARGRYADALVQLDRIMTTSAASRPALLGVLVQLSADPGFVQVLTSRLAARPDWRAAYLQALQRDASADTNAAVMAALAGDGGLDPAEDARWIDQLIQRGQWGQAYAHWAGTLAPGAVLSPVFNPGFEAVPSGSGFDWRSPPLPGQTVTVEAGPPGATGQVAALEFRGRPAPRIGLEQALLLAPGAYRLQARIRAEDLRSDAGLEWVVACADGRILGRSPRIGGSLDWTTVAAPLQVPADCPGQWLRLRNPGPTERTQWTQGRLWVDQVRIDPVAPAPVLVPDAPAR